MFFRYLGERLFSSQRRLSSSQSASYKLTCWNSSYLHQLLSPLSPSADHAYRVNSGACNAPLFSLSVIFPCAPSRSGDQVGRKATFGFHLY